jgi:hypothetical protein
LSTDHRLPYPGSKLADVPEVKEYYLREQTLRKFGPKKGESRRCPICDDWIVAGEYSTLIALGPGDNPEARKRSRESRPYTAVAVEVHWSCATGEE